MSKPYYDQKLDKDAVQKLLRSVNAKHSPQRSQPGIVVYKLEGDGEGMVERVGDKFRVRLFKGRCAC